MARDRKIDEQDVARRAYEIYEARGATDGADLDDWLQAERELLGVGISNRESPAEEERGRQDFPPVDPDWERRDDLDGSTNQTDAQSKKGSRSGAQKSSASAYTERTMPAAAKVSGAFGREER